MKRILVAFVAAAAVSAAFAKIPTTELFEDNDYTNVFWSVGTDADDSVLVDYQGDKPVFDAPYPCDGYGSKYLLLDTGDATLWCSNSVAGNVYFDMVMQFNVSASDPDLDNDTKVAVYQNANSNLVIVAGDGSNGRAKTLYEVASPTINPGEWGRVTIASTNGSDGLVFGVYLDGQRLSSNGTNEFQSLTADTSVSQMGLSGSGAIDDFVVRTTDPFIDDPIAKIGGEGYASLSEAMSDATAGDTVVLQKASSENVVLPAAGVVFDPNGNVYGSVSAADGLGWTYDETSGVYTADDNSASTWVGDEDDFWSVASNWSNHAVPTASTTVTFDTDGRVRIGAGYGSVDVGAMVVNANVTFAEDNLNYANYPSVKTRGNITGSGKLILERCGIHGNGGEVAINCNLGFTNDTVATSSSIHDSFLVNGTFTINGDISGFGYLKIAGTTPTINGDITLAGSQYGMVCFQAAATINGAVALGDSGNVEFWSSTHTFGSEASLSGTGRVICYTIFPSATLKPLLQNGGEGGWAGTFEIRAKDSSSLKKIVDLDVDDYGNADSTVCLNGVTGYFPYGSNGSTHYVSNVKCLEIGPLGLSLKYDSDSDQYSNRKYMIASDITGTGTMSFATKTGTPHSKYVFTGDVSGFSGAINFEGLSSNRPVVVFKTDEEEIPASTDYGQIIVSAGRTGGSAVPVLATWGAPGGFVIDGEVDVAASGSLACSSGGNKIAGSGVISYEELPSSPLLFNAAWSGTVAFSGSTDEEIDLNAYAVSGSTVRFSGFTAPAVVAGNCQCDLELVGDGLTLNGSTSSNNAFVVEGKLKGAGSLTMANSSYTTTARFAGDVSAFTGDISVSGTSRVAFGSDMAGNAPVIYVHTGASVTNAAGATWNSANIVLWTDAELVANGTVQSTAVLWGSAGSVYRANSSSASIKPHANWRGTYVVGWQPSGALAAETFGNSQSTVSIAGTGGSGIHFTNGGAAGIPVNVTATLDISDDVLIDNGWPISATSTGDALWSHERINKVSALTGSADLNFQKPMGTWSLMRIFYHVGSLDYAGLITVGTNFALRVDSVSHAAPIGVDECVARINLSTGGTGGYNLSGVLYGPDGNVLSSSNPIPVADSDTKLVYATKGDVSGLYAAVAQIGEGYYGTIAEAIAVATSAGVDEITKLASTAEELPAGWREENGKYVKIAYIAQIEGGSSYESLAAAVADAQAGDTINLLADDHVSFSAENLEIGINKSLTINGNGFALYGVEDYEYSSAAGDHDIYISGSSDVSISNLTLSGFGGAATVNRHTFPIWTGSAYSGNLTLENVTVSNFNHSALNFNGGTILVKDCTLVGDRTGRNAAGDYYQRGICVFNADVTVVDCDISGMGAQNATDETSAAAGCLEVVGNGSTIGTGTITVRDGAYEGQFAALVGSNASGSITIADGEFDGLLQVDDGSAGAISITGGTFSVDPTEFCADGYAADEVAGEWVVSAAYSVTYVIDLEGATNAVDNITSYTVNTPEFTLLPAGCEGYDFVAWTNFVGDVVETIAGGATVDIVLYASWSGQSQKYDAGDSVECGSAQAATNLAEQITANPVNYVNVPAGVADGPAYCGLFKGVVDGTSVKIVLTEEAADDIEEDLNGAAATIPLSALATGTALGTQVTVDVVPGIWYSVSQGSSLTNMQEGTRVQATDADGGTLTFLLGHQAAAGFYRVNANVVGNAPAQQNP